MSELLRIPFGLRLTDQKLVDVSEVDRGRTCGCICPSCKTPLIARQGEVNEWHFAHASKGVSSDTENECEYSFWLSVTLMAKQVIETADFITLPSLNMYTNEAVEVRVSEQKTVALDEVKIEQKVNSVLVDATLKLGKYIIAIIFTVPDRYSDNCPPSITKSDSVGLLEISLENAVHWLFGSRNQGKYAQVLESNILSNDSCKKWLYHPRKSTIERKYNVELYEQNPTPLGMYNENPSLVEQKEYNCHICKNNWHGTNECTNCNTHLYSQEVKNA